MLHTLWIANDNDFLLATLDTPPIPNPNQFFVFGFTDADLGSTLMPQFKDFHSDFRDFEYLPQAEVARLLVTPPSSLFRLLPVRVTHWR
jgi:hypothetical protein